MDSKRGLEKKAKLLFNRADEDGSGQLSIIECFAILPSIELMLKRELTKLAPGQYESCSEAFSESSDEEIQDMRIGEDNHRI